MTKIVGMQPTGIIGVMSGTSLDGLDIAWCEFVYENNRWMWQIKAADTIAYSPEWTQRLRDLPEQRAVDLARTDADYGRYIGKAVKDFIMRYGCTASYVSSHGHTVFHQPHHGFTLQTGHGAYIAREVRLPVVCDFRSTDVALGGQGAPLVPIGDALLFPEYDACLNLGGFANISFEKDGQRIAFDICAVNTVLNHLANSMGLPYDDGGRMAETGKVNVPLLEKLNALTYYTKSAPKSLGMEWVQQHIFPLLQSASLTTTDAMATYLKHAAQQIAQTIKPQQHVLITGGGAYNTTLLSQLNQFGVKYTVPEKQVVEYKEALVFALLGMLRIHGHTNVWKSYTGASSDSISGCMYYY